MRVAGEKWQHAILMFYRAQRISAQQSCIDQQVELNENTAQNNEKSLISQ